MKPVQKLWLYLHVWNKKLNKLEKKIKTLSHKIKTKNHKYQETGIRRPRDQSTNYPSIGGATVALLDLRGK